MILAIDVHYKTIRAKAVGLVFESWNDSTTNEVVVAYIDKVEEYVPGAFYKRELPCLMQVIEKTSASIDCIVIDGYVTLGTDQKPGLGMYLYKALNEAIPIIGVAKTSYAGNNPSVHEVIRGSSEKPLFVTSIGMEVNEAASKISDMHGEHRFPTLLALLDQYTKQE